MVPVVVLNRSAQMNVRCQRHKRPVSDRDLREKAGGRRDATKADRYSEEVVIQCAGGCSNEPCAQNGSSVVRSKARPLSRGVLLPTVAPPPLPPTAICYPRSAVYSGPPPKGPTSLLAPSPFNEGPLPSTTAVLYPPAAVNLQLPCSAPITTHYVQPLLSDDGSGGRGGGGRTHTPTHPPLAYTPGHAPAQQGVHAVTHLRMSLPTLVERWGWGGGGGVPPRLLRGCQPSLRRAVACAVDQVHPDGPCWVCRLPQ